MSGQGHGFDDTVTDTVSSVLKQLTGTSGDAVGAAVMTAAAATGARAPTVTAMGPPGLTDGAADTHEAQRPQPFWGTMSTVAVQAPRAAASVVVRGGLGFGPVASPGEQVDVGSRQAMRQTGRMRECVTVVVGVTHSSI